MVRHNPTANPQPPLTGRDFDRLDLAVVVALVLADAIGVARPLAVARAFQLHLGRLARQLRL